MKSYRITIDYSTTNPYMVDPDKWNWYDILDPDIDEAFTIVDVEDIDTPEAHIEDLGSPTSPSGDNWYQTQYDLFTEQHT